MKEIRVCRCWLIYMCADRGIAFSPVDPYLPLERMQLERMQYVRAESKWQICRV